MKTHILCWGFHKKNWVPISITIITLTVSLFMLITIFGKYEYRTYTLHILENSALTNAVYCMPVSIGDELIDADKSMKAQHTLMRQNGVADIINYQYSFSEYNHNGCNVFIYDEVFRNNFKLSVQEGRWFSEEPSCTEAVIGGVIWDNVSLGDTVTLENGISALVVGIMGDSVVYPAMTRASNSILTADDLFKEVDNIIFLSAETIDSKDRDRMNLRTANNFFTIFKDGIREQDRESIIQYIETQGNYRECQQIIEDSYCGIKDWLKQQLPLPLFLTCIATINMVCICAIMIKRTMPDMAKYYVLGCTKMNSIKLIFVSMLEIFLIPIGSNLVQALFFPDFLRLELNHRYIDYIINWSSIYPIIIYSGILLVIFICIPVLFYRHYAPLELYRRNI